MKTDHRLFFAIPFDSATKNLYERVCQTIRDQYPNITTVIGNREVGPSQRHSDIASFKAQNRELTKQFVHQIRDADIIVADLTHNNPNVHVELGIALVENKNILRVTGRSVTELGFDIRNLVPRNIISFVFTKSMIYWRQLNEGGCHVAKISSHLNKGGT